MLLLLSTTTTSDCQSATLNFQHRIISLYFLIELSDKLISAAAGSKLLPNIKTMTLLLKLLVRINVTRLGLNLRSYILFVLVCPCKKSGDQYYFNFAGNSRGITFTKTLDDVSDRTLKLSYFHLKY